MSDRAMNDRAHGDVRAPGLLRLALEARAPWEFGASLAALPLLRSAPAGDGHAVLVFPGLAASDVSTGMLRRYLTECGYDTHKWMQGRNLGPRPGVLAGCRDRVLDLYRSSGRKISLVGWSLGGIYARETAKVVPEAVRSVITLGTPFSGHPKATNAWRVYELATGERVDDGARSWPHLADAPPVPTTSIYSRTDGIVNWKTCLEAESATTDNIEVEGSHCGLGHHPAAVYAIAEKLAQPEGKWAKFDRSGWKALVYPNPKRR